MSLTDKQRAAAERIAAPPVGPFPLTDLGNSERLVAMHGHEIRHAPGLGWMVWDGRRWARDDTGGLLRRAKLTARAIYHDAAGCENDDERKRIAGWAHSSEFEARLKAMVSLAASELAVVVRAGDLDANPYLLNCQNGALDLKTGELRPHAPGDLLTRLAGASYTPTAPSSVWAAFVERILPHAEVRGYVQRLLGVAAVGELLEHVLPFFHGGGANGKSTLLDAVRFALGDYAIQMPADVLMLKRDGMSAGDQSALMQLRGVRLASTVETEDGRRLAESLVKSLTGETRIRAKLMRQDPVEFTASHTLVLAANHRPRIAGTDLAIWRRIHLVPFEETIAPGEQDRRLGAKLAAEADGVLAWIVAGCVDYQQRGLDPPAAVIAATAAYRTAEDPLGDWLAWCCVLEPDAWTATADLRGSYEQFCGAEGTDAVGDKRYSDSLGNRGCSRDQERSRGPPQGMERRPITPRL